MNSRDKDWKNASSLFKRRFRSRHDPQILRAIIWENRESQDTRQKIEFFLFCQNIPFSDLI